MLGVVFFSCVFGLLQPFQCSVGAPWGKGGAKAHLEEQCAEQGYKGIKFRHFSATFCSCDIRR